jgi:hypothetical protein
MSFWNSLIEVAPLRGWLAGCFLVLPLTLVTAAEPLRIVEELPERPPVAMRTIKLLTGAELGTAEGPGGSQAPHGSYPGHENSGIVKSRQFPDLFWLQNDSGDEPRVYPIRANGEDYQSARASEKLGVLIGGAINIDWEDITINASGQLIVCDLGNNRNDRRDLVFYLIPEPAPQATRAAYLTRYFVRYPDQTEFPAPKANFNFDCEGVFTVGDTIHLFSKNRSDKLTTLYRLDDPQPEVINPLTKLDTLDLRGQVTGADATADGKRLVVITYQTIWLFERDSLEESFFAGRVRWAPYKAEQIESVCFADDATLLLIDEATGVLHSVAIADLTTLR